MEHVINASIKDKPRDTRPQSYIVLYLVSQKVKGVPIGIEFGFYPYGCTPVKSEEILCDPVVCVCENAICTVRRRAGYCLEHLEAFLT